MCEKTIKQSLQRRIVGLIAIATDFMKETPVILITVTEAHLLSHD